MTSSREDNECYATKSIPQKSLMVSEKQFQSIVLSYDILEQGFIGVNNHSKDVILFSKTFLDD